MISSNFAYYALKVDPSQDYNMFSSEAFAKAAEVAILGMGMVFLVLAILWGVLAIFKLIFAREPKKKKVIMATPVVEEAKEVTPATPATQETDDGELIAIITAAVAAYRAENEGADSASSGGFRVVSFKRSGAGRAWNSKK